MAQKTYDPAKHLFSFAGNLIPNGFGKDSFIKVSRAEDGFTHTKGVTGEGARSKNNNRAGEVEITLLASSQSNDILAAIAAADELSSLGVGPLFLKELNGTMVCAGQNAWIKKQPDIERGKEVGETVWTFTVDDLDMFAGGLA